MTLQNLFEKQRDLMDVVIERTGPTTIQTTLLALFTEVAEFANADGSWKTWKLNHHADHEQELEEIVDILFFLIQLMILKGYTANMIADAYDKKWQKNIDRQRNDY